MFADDPTDDDVLSVERASYSPNIFMTITTRSTRSIEHILPSAIEFNHNQPIMRNQSQPSLVKCAFGNICC